MEKGICRYFPVHLYVDPCSQAPLDRAMMPPGVRNLFHGKQQNGSDWRGMPTQLWCPPKPFKTTQKHRGLQEQCGVWGRAMGRGFWNKGRERHQANALAGRMKRRRGKEVLHHTKLPNPCFGGTDKCIRPSPCLAFAARKPEAPTWYQSS